MRMEHMIEEELGKKETQVRYARTGSQVLFGKVREAEDICQEVQG